MRPFIEASLRRLHNTSGTVDDINDACALEQSKLHRLGCRLPATYSSHSGTHRVCPRSVKLIRRCEPSLLKTAIPAATIGDGNCLYRAFSRAVYGYEDAHLLLRLLAAIEVGLHPDTYDATRATSHELLRNPLIVSPPYADLFHELSII